MSMSIDICNFCSCATRCQKISDIRERLFPEPLVSRPRDQKTTGSGDENGLLSSARAMACAIYSFCKVYTSVEINIFTKEEVFRLNVTVKCKNSIIISFKTF